MNLHTQYIIVGIIIGVCLAVAVGHLVKRLRARSKCASCDSTTCPLKNKPN